MTYFQFSVDPDDYIVVPDALVPVVLAFCQQLTTNGTIICERFGDCDRMQHRVLGSTYHVFAFPDKIKAFIRNQQTPEMRVTEFED